MRFFTGYVIVVYANRLPNYKFMNRNVHSLQKLYPERLFHAIPEPT